MRVFSLVSKEESKKTNVLREVVDHQGGLIVLEAQVAEAWEMSSSN